MKANLKAQQLIIARDSMSLSRVTVFTLWVSFKCHLIITMSLGVLADIVKLGVSVLCPIRKSNISCETSFLHARLVTWVVTMLWSGNLPSDLRSARFSSRAVSVIQSACQEPQSVGGPEIQCLSTVHFWPCARIGLAWSELVRISESWLVVGLFLVSGSGCWPGYVLLPLSLEVSRPWFSFVRAVVFWLP